MGKKTRKRHRNRQSDSNKNSNSKNPDDPSISKLTQRIRFSDDPETKQAALTAVLNNAGRLLHKDRPLLQAVREQLVVVPSRNDHKKHTIVTKWECALLAAGCLSNYLHATAANSSIADQYISNKTDKDVLSSSDPNHSQTSSTAAVVESDHAMTAGWMVLLVGRLKQVQQEQVSAQESDNQQYSYYLEEFTHRCLECLCQLIETNPLAMKRLLDNDQELLDDFCLVLFRYLQQWSLNRDAQCLSASVSSPMTLLLTARCLHSAFDDNPDFVLPWLVPSEGSSSSSDQGRRGYQLLQIMQEIIQASTPSFPDTSETGSKEDFQQVLFQTAQIHVAGAWIAAWMTIRDASSTTNHDESIEVMSLLEEELPTAIKSLQTVVSDAVGPQDLAATGSGSSTFSSPTYQQLLEVHQKYQQERLDVEMERDVIRKQNQKKEPARLIARRLQQKQKEEEERKAQEGEDSIGNTDKDMDMDEEEETISTKPSIDSRQVWSELWEDWNTRVRPCQLALEILANLTADMMPSPSSMHDHGMDIADEMEGPPWLLAKNPETVGQLTTTIQTFLVNLSSSVSPESIPPFCVVETLRDLQSKAGICLGHLLAAGALVDRPQQLWSELIQIVKSAATPLSDTCMKDDCNDKKDDQQSLLLVSEGVTSAMVLILQKYQEQTQKTGKTSTMLQSICQTSGDLTVLVSFLDLLSFCATHSHSESVSPSTVAVMMRDMVSALGILLSSTCDHSVAINAQVCRVLVKIQALDKTKTCSFSAHDKALVLSETLNSLMDIYGGDDDGQYDTVIKEERVLELFQSSASHLKSLVRLAQVSRGKNEDFDDEERVMLHEQWKETAMNAARFVQYKKEQMAL